MVLEASRSVRAELGQHLETVPPSQRCGWPPSISTAIQAPFPNGRTGFVHGEHFFAALLRSGLSRRVPFSTLIAPLPPQTHQRAGTGTLGAIYEKLLS